jgi:hypothetical protein
VKAVHIGKAIDDSLTPASLAQSELHSLCNQALADLFDPLRGQSGQGATKERLWRPPKHKIEYGLRTTGSTT